MRWRLQLSIGRMLLALTLFGLASSLLVLVSRHQEYDAPRLCTFASFAAIASIGCGIAALIGRRPLVLMIYVFVVLLGYIAFEMLAPLSY